MYVNHRVRRKPHRLTSNDPIEMYGPPLVCKRKVTKAVWSAQMYPASVEQKRSGHSMEYAALSSWILPQPRRLGLVSITGSRERWVRPFCHLKFRQQTWQILFNSENQKQLAVVAGVRLWKSRSDFQAWRSCQASIAHQLGSQILTTEQRGPVNFSFGQHCPCDTGKFVGQCHGYDILMGARR